MIWIVVAAVVIVVAIVLVRRGGKWQALLTASGDAADEVRAKYTHLMANNIQCKLKTEIGAVLGATAGTEAETTTLLIHEQDIDKAKSLLEQYEKESQLLSF
jgi:hypothetical protein